MTFQTQTLARRDVRWALTAGLAAAAFALAWAAPQWLVFVLTLALAKGVVVLGLLLLMRTGLVSFGQGLYFGLGAYGAALLGHWGKIADAALMLLAGTLAAAAIAAILGLLLARYRAIFFAMLSLAFSMILYGTLVKTSALGSTDGFNLHAKAFAGVALAAGANGASSSPPASSRSRSRHRSCTGCWARTGDGSRPRFATTSCASTIFGASVYRVVYVNYVIAGALAGLGGALPLGRRTRRSGHHLLDHLGRVRVHRRARGHRQRHRSLPVRDHLRGTAHARKSICIERVADVARARHAGHHHVPSRRIVVAGKRPGRAA